MYRKIIQIMRLTTVILLASLLQVSGSTLAQKISLTKSNAPLKAVLKEIKNQSGYDFIATESLFKMAKPVSINIRNTDFEAVLKQVFDDQPLTYSINNTTITIKEKSPSLLDKARDVILNLVQDLVVRGKILDEGGKPLEGATVVLKGSNRTVKTDVKGEFALANVPDDGVLVIRYVGYKQLEISLKDAVMPLEIKLNVATGELEEVKVVFNTGYQELNKERSTGSFVQIDNKLFNRAVGPTVIDRILHVTNGLISSPTTNASQGNIVIRGVSTINAGKDALVVVDNFPYDGDIKNLNPNDVESITILKDAAAASIWGVKAGNGVIVITTKKGQFGNLPRVAFNTNLTTGYKPDLDYVPIISSTDMIEVEKTLFGKGLYNDYDDLYPFFDYYPVISPAAETLLAARKLNASDPDYNALKDPVVLAKLANMGKHDVRDDIKKYLLRTSVDQQYSLNLSGGGSDFNYYASIGFDKSKGNNLNEENRRLTVNFHNTWRPFKNLEITGNFVRTTVKNENSDVNYSSLLPNGQSSPYTRLADEYGNSLSIPYGYRTAYIDTASYPSLLDWRYRPLENYKYIDNNELTYDSRISGILKYTVQPWLKAEFQYQNQFVQSIIRNMSSQESFAVRDGINQFMNVAPDGRIIYPWPLGDLLNLTDGTLKIWNLRGSLSFDKSIGQHRVNVFTGLEFRETNAEKNYGIMYGYNSDTYTSQPVDVVNLTPIRPPGLGLIGAAPDPTGTLARNGSVFGNLSYGFEEKYLATFSGRIDQSNFFGVKANLRKVPLWHTVLRWNIFLEDFYNFDWLEILKLRASFGYTGNTNSGATSYATFSYRAGGETIPPRNISYGRVLPPNNPVLRWERVEILNVGVDFSIKNKILSGSVDFYRKKGLDLLGPIITDPTVGVSSYTGNYASIKIKGIDLTLNASTRLPLEMGWRSNFLLSFNSDNVISYAGSEPSISATIDPRFSPVIVGRPLYGMYSIGWAGLDAQTGDPQILLSGKVSHYENFNKATKDDVLYNGQRNPKLFGAFRNTIIWKELSISANVSYKFGHHFKRSSINYSNLFLNGYLSEHSDFGKRWIEPGDELFTDIPSLPNELSNSMRDNSYLKSDVLVEKGDHVRFQDIRIDYTLNNRMLKNMALAQLSLFVYAANLGIIWRANKSGVDPDAYEFGSIPAPKTISIGIKANY
jgi:TonB-linked SusC/RagA family outer membrane protein